MSVRQNKGISISWFVAYHDLSFYLTVQIKKFINKYNLINIRT